MAKNSSRRPSSVPSSMRRPEVSSSRTTIGGMTARSAFARQQAEHGHVVGFRGNAELNHHRIEGRSQCRFRRQQDQGLRRQELRQGPTDQFGRRGQPDQADRLRRQGIMHKVGAGCIARGRAGTRFVSATSIESATNARSSSGWAPERSTASTSDRPIRGSMKPIWKFRESVANAQGPPRRARIAERGRGICPPPCHGPGFLNPYCH